jgi:hypothetical protein
MMQASMDSGFLRRLFMHHDKDRSGGLDCAEFKEALTSMGCNLTPHEFESTVEYFDPNGTGSIDYGELMWGCFNSEQLLKKWRKRTRGKSRDQIRSIFYNYLSFGDKLGPRHLQRVMNEVFHADLSGEEVRVLFRKVGLKTCNKCSSQR